MVIKRMPGAGTKQVVGDVVSRVFRTSSVASVAILSNMSQGFCYYH